MYEHAKHQWIPLVYSWDTINLRVHRLDWLYLFFYHAQTKNLWSTFNFCEFVSTNKKWGCFIDFFWRSNWFNPAIWLAEQELCLKTKKNLDFHYKTNSVIRSTTKFFFKFKKSFFGLFLAHFPNIWGKKSFSKKFGSFVCNSIRDFNAMPRFREN